MERRSRVHRNFIPFKTIEVVLRNPDKHINNICIIKYKDEREHVEISNLTPIKIVGNVNKTNLPWWIPGQRRGEESQKTKRDLNK